MGNLRLTSSGELQPSLLLPRGLRGGGEEFYVKIMQSVCCFFLEEENRARVFVHDKHARLPLSRRR